MRNATFLTFYCISLIWCCAAAHAADNLNADILRTIEGMERGVAGRGYDLHSSFTEDLHYGEACCVPATNNGKTMCVALVTEVLLRTLDQLGKKNRQVFSDFPISQFKRSQYLNILPHLYQYKGVASRGPGDALSRFGIGEIVPFEAMLPGDMMAFSRFNGSGHAVVFRRYIDAANETLNAYSPKVVGFEYFSAQESTRGIGRRLAYFGALGKTGCPANAPPRSDCGIIRHNYINAGRLWSPERWTVAASMAALKAEFVRAASRGGAVSDERVEELLQAEVAAVSDVDFSE